MTFTKLSLMSAAFSVSLVPVSSHARDAVPPKIDDAEISEVFKASRDGFRGKFVIPAEEDSQGLPTETTVSDGSVRRTRTLHDGSASVTVFSRKFGKSRPDIAPGAREVFLTDKEDGSSRRVVWLLHRDRLYSHVIDKNGKLDAKSPWVSFIHDNAVSAAVRKNAELCGEVRKLRAQLGSARMDIVVGLGASSAMPVPVTGAHLGDAPEVRFSEDQSAIMLGGEFIGERHLENLITEKLDAALSANLPEYAHIKKRSLELKSKDAKALSSLEKEELDSLNPKREQYIKRAINICGDALK